VQPRTPAPPLSLCGQAVGLSVAATMPWCGGWPATARRRAAPPFQSARVVAVAVAAAVAAGARGATAALPATSLERVRLPLRNIRDVDRSSAGI